MRGWRRAQTWGLFAAMLMALLGGAGADGTRVAQAAPADETVVLAGGCFWGVQGVFQRVRGVTRAVSGYAGGPADAAHYELVSRGTTGHAESVEVTYDPAQVTYAKILEVFFAVAHDPTQLNRQGPDVGTQYRSAIFYRSPAQKADAQAYIERLTAAKAYPRAIVTQVVPLAGFYRAEDYHQDYLDKHPDEPYIVFHDWPKIEALRKRFPALYVER
jgi:peptide-methionine (S)-S-oxide reductase